MAVSSASYPTMTDVIVTVSVAPDRRRIILQSKPETSTETNSLHVHTGYVPRYDPWLGMERKVRPLILNNKKTWVNLRKFTISFAEFILTPQTRSGGIFLLAPSDMTTNTKKTKKQNKR